jgi:uncharacterized repeat protein (TIGR01451 family)
VRADNPLGVPLDGNPDGILYRVDRDTSVATAVARTPFSSDFATLPIPAPTVPLIAAKVRESTLVPGSPINYTISVSNPPGTCDLTDISFNDPVPPFVTGITWSSQVTGVGSVTPASGSGSPTNLLLNLDTGSTATITIRGTIDPNNPVVANNIAEIKNPLGINPEPPIRVSDSPIPLLRLVKRITNITRRGTPIAGLTFNTFIDDPADPNDTVPGWSQLSPVGILRAASLPLIKTGDEIEYTVYYLNDGTTDLTDTGICDAIPEQTLFVPNSLQVKPGAAAIAPGGQFFSPLAPLPPNNPCTNKTNTNGTALLNLGTLPNAVGSNFGFFRFRTRIN